MKLISSLPNKITTWRYQQEHKNIYEILNAHIELWQQEKSPNIIHFANIFNYSFEHKNILAQVLYACMEKNNVNLTFLKNLTPLRVTETISESRYPILHKLIKETNLSYISEFNGITFCLDLLKETSVLDTIVSSIKTRSIKKEYTTKSTNVNNQEDLNILSYIFKNLDYSKLLNPSKSLNTIDALKNKIEQTNLLIYLTTCHSKRFRLMSNMTIILKQLDKIIPNSNDKLKFLTAMTILRNTKKYQTSTSLHNAFQQTFPEEHKLTQTLLFLGVTDFDTIWNTIENKNTVVNTPKVELPLL